MEVLRDAEILLSNALMGDRSIRREMWMWLVSDAAHLPVLPGNRRLVSFFTKLCLDPHIRKKEERACHCLLQILIEKKADQVAELLFDCKPEAYASLFMIAKSQDILLWFDHFTDNGLGHFQFGSKALTQYALRKREEVWDLLVWSSTHAHAPVTVASQPHLFSKLNVEETVRNLARHSRSFWRSREFGDSLKGGQLVAIDRPYFVKELFRLLDEEGKSADAVVRLLSGFIGRCSLTDLMQKVLPLLTDEALLRCLCHALGREVTDSGGDSVFQMGRRALQSAIFSVASFSSVDELLLFNALALRSGQVLRTLRQEASQEELKDIMKMLEEVQTCMGHWGTVLLDNSISRTRRMKAMILRLFAARYSLEESFKGGQEAITATFARNKVLYSNASSATDGSHPHTVDTDSRLESKQSAKYMKVSGKKLEKDSKLHKHKSKRKRQKHASDSEVDEHNLLEGYSGAPSRWQISFEKYCGECTETDAAECLHMLAACIHMDAWQTL
ncbi:hypothetical protein COCOBI_01-5260 [Coccomyxa sp. Obi]|nr:hypothetical protein COCOBI_01-5260 [Coccomyxa sp. Obi]